MSRADDEAPGERTPVGIRLSKAPASIPEHWMVCKTARRLKTALSSGAGSDYAASLAGTDAVRQPQDLLDILNPRVVEQIDGKKESGEWYVVSCCEMVYLRLLIGCSARIAYWAS